MEFVNMLTNAFGRLQDMAIEFIGDPNNVSVDILIWGFGILLIVAVIIEVIWLIKLKFLSNSLENEDKNDDLEVKNEDEDATIEESTIEESTIEESTIEDDDDDGSAVTDECSEEDENKKIQ